MRKNNILRSVTPSEHQIQCAIVEWASKTKFKNNPWGKMHIDTTPIKKYLISNPMGGYRIKSEAIRLKREGATSGVSDLFLAYPVSRHLAYHIRCGLWIEVKTKTGKVSEHQYEWIKLMQSAGYEALIIRSVDEGIQAIKDYLGMR